MRDVTPEQLAKHLDDLAAGRASLRACLTGLASAEAGELLGIAAAIAAPRLLSLDPTVKTRQRAVLLEAIAASLRSTTRSAAIGRWDAGWGGLRRLGATPPRGLAFVAPLILAVVLGSGGIVYAARDALPGDALYPVKTAVEQVQLGLATSDAARARTYLALADRRLSEIEKAERDNRPSAAQAAASSLARDLAAANQSFARVAASGTDARDLASLLSTSLARVAERVASAGAGGRATDETALATAAQEATRGLGVARAYVSSPGEKATPTAEERDDRPTGDGDAAPPRGDTEPVAIATPPPASPLPSPTSSSPAATPTAEPVNPSAQPDHRPKDTPVPDGRPTPVPQSSTAVPAQPAPPGNGAGHGNGPKPGNGPTPKEAPHAPGGNAVGNPDPSSHGNPARGNPSPPGKGASPPRGSGAASIFRASKIVSPRKAPAVKHRRGPSVLEW